MSNLRSKIRWATGILLLVVASPIIIGVVGEFFIELAREAGLYDNPSKMVGDVMTALNAFVTQTWFLLLAALICGLTAGLWLDVFLRKKEGRVSRESEEKKLRRKAQIAVDDMRAEAVACRNELIPALKDYDHDVELAKLKDWNKRVLEKLDEAGVPVGARSHVRTLNFYQAVYHDDEGKDGRQSKLESIWTEKINRLQKIIDGFD